MRAKFYSDIDLENFKDEALSMHGVEAKGEEGNREVVIMNSDCAHISEELRALVQINGGDVYSMDME